MLGTTVAPNHSGAFARAPVRSRRSVLTSHERSLPHGRRQRDGPNLLLRRHSLPNVNRELLHVVLPASIAFAPLGWLFDSSVLIPTHVRVVSPNQTGGSARNIRLHFMLALVLIQAFGSVALGTVTFEHELYWIPLTVLLLSLVRWGLGADRKRLGAPKEST